jgi:hypothetical protein
LGPRLKNALNVEISEIFRNFQEFLKKYHELKKFSELGNFQKFHEFENITRVLMNFIGIFKNF